MNDAGGDKIDESLAPTLDKPSSNGNGGSSGTSGKEGKDSNDKPDMLQSEVLNDQSHLAPSRWWLASSAIPMIAGTLGPVANAFSICALVRPWRQDFPPGSDIDSAAFVPDPIWLVIVNAIQVVMAVIANVILLLNMAKKIRFSVAQPLTIAAWYISSFCLIALTATASGPLIKEPETQYIWSQAFWYGIWAAILYFSCSSLMCITFYGAKKGHFPQDFQLTTSQRTLMLQTIMFLMYLLVGALVYSKVEGWEYLDAVYWANVTLFTVGFGDFYPKTPLGRGLLFPYALIGIISLGLVIGSIRSMVLDRGKHRLDARIVEKKRRRTVRKMNKKGDQSILVPVGQGDEEQGLPHSSTGLTEYERREKEFELMRNIQAVAEKRRRWMAMAVSTSSLVALWLIGAVIFWQAEVSYQSWGYFDGFYFAFVTLTTIGYGDTTPISPCGKSFFVFWALLALPAMTILISNAGDTVVKSIQEATDTLGTITILPGERGVSKDWKEFIRFLSFGALFDKDFQPSFPGFLGIAQQHQDASSSDSSSSDDSSSSSSDTEEGTNGGGATAGAGKRMKTERNAKQGVDTEKSKYKQADVIDADKQRKLSKTTSKGSSNSSSDKPGGIAPEPSPRNEKDGQDQDANLESTQKVKKTHKSKKSTSLLPPGAPNEVPRNVEDYHVTLIEEIIKVTKDLAEKPPHKYTFQEWAWYLKLIGEDEASSEKHRKATGAPKHKLPARGHTSNPENNAQNQGSNSNEPSNTSGATSEQKRKQSGASMSALGNDESPTTAPSPQETEQQQSTQSSADPPASRSADVDDPPRLAWSWVGARSPLMGGQEEAEWILAKLQARLADSLKTQRGGS